MALNKLTTRLKGKLIMRNFSIISIRQQQALTKSDEVVQHTRTDETWMNAKDYETIPGPSKLGLFRDFLPGGKLHNSNLIEINRSLRERYGDILRIRGLMGKPDVVFTYNPDDIEQVYRNEGIWPERMGLDSFHYYRKVKRPDVFQGIGGLVSEQGKAWGDIRNKVNPVLMKVQNIRQNLPHIDRISTEFITRLETLRDPNTNFLKNHVLDEIKMWAFESVCAVALNTRMGLLTGESDDRAYKLAQNLADFFQYSFEYDVVPSFWKYIETPGFKRLIRTYDNITEITTSYIDAAMKKFEKENNAEAKSVLEKLCRIDKKVAIVMAMDMLMAGMDTTSSAFITTLYYIAKNPEKQENLRDELKSIMSQRDTPLTEANTKNMPYMRACIKEALRITPITPAGFRTAGQDLVLSGYKVPKGVFVQMDVMTLSNTEQYFPRCKEFLPERWLKSGPSACPEAKNTNPFVYMPFGFGPRTCIGKRLAEMEIETLIAKLIRNYRITWESEKSLTYKSNIILVPDGDLKFKFEKI